MASLFFQMTILKILKTFSFLPTLLPISSQSSSDPGDFAFLTFLQFVLPIP